jgi:hypothetical protein
MLSVGLIVPGFQREFVQTGLLPFVQGQHRGVVFNTPFAARVCIAAPVALPPLSIT